MRILGIETSCDETAISVIEISGSRARSRIKVLSNIVSSQAKLHAKFGGVVPNLAKREHQRNLVPALLAALQEARLRELRSKNKELRMRSSAKTRNSKFSILNSILVREPDSFARMVEYVLPMKPPAIDAIAVTVGPGLAPALWVGVNFARALSFLWQKPLIPVNHMTGHLYSSLLQPAQRNPKFEIRNPKQIQNFPPKADPPLAGKSKTKNRLGFRVSSLEFPAIALLVSGGHTELVLMRGYGKYKVVGETLDDAAGEAFDKVAKMLGLGFPGGPPISAAAEMELKVKSLPRAGSRGPKLKVNLPRPMIHSKDFNFSFSGLKTAVLYLLRDLRGKYPLSKIRPAVASEFQQAVVDVLVSKTIRAAKKSKVKTVMIGGGVAANKKLRHELGEALTKTLPAVSCMLPVTSLTGDNALMIALAGWFNRNKKTAWRSVQADANLRLR
ncbi:tRNA (adenosine(37)-N6)-threonylcarbamoyltransferase complex transferase subunit TsaD [Candidatus Giovannonibacteria bacterium]|nr:tRNA (adenosine(37)-N6)-threonylcarbamoyltransferase complex transferase subunit TsaD [Candidatus Giovannonibacteria bacterium]